jgi:hypothetical protein
MNYIKRLQNENDEKEKTIEQLRDIMHELRLYMMSDKFQGNCDLSGYVNIRDVLLRLEEN